MCPGTEPKGLGRHGEEILARGGQHCLSATLKVCFTCPGSEWSASFHRESLSGSFAGTTLWGFRFPWVPGGQSSPCRGREEILGPATGWGTYTHQEADVARSFLQMLVVPAECEAQGAYALG